MRQLPTIPQWAPTILNLCAANLFLKLTTPMGKAMATYKELKEQIKKLNEEAEAARRAELQTTRRRTLEGRPIRIDYRGRLWAPARAAPHYEDSSVAQIPRSENWCNVERPWSRTRVDQGQETRPLSDRALIRSLARLLTGSPRVRSKVRTTLPHRRRNRYAAPAPTQASDCALRAAQLLPYPCPSTRQSGSACNVSCRPEVAGRLCEQVQALAAK